jgi:DNA repair protein RadC
LEAQLKYHSRTISWKFREATAELPELKGKQSVIIKSPRDLHAHYHTLFDNQVRERFVVFWLNAANKVVGFEIITEGLLNSSLTHPREIFRGAIIATAASIIIAHNHPSGNSEPSEEDIRVTRQIVEAGKIIGIPVHDHLIFTNETFTSLAESGLI